MSNDILELFSFEIDATVFDTEKVFYLNLPESWRNFLEKDKNHFNLKLKPQNLAKKLQAVFPPIFYISWKQDEPWLFSDKEVDPSLLKLIGLNWFAKENECSVEDLSFELQHAPLVWQSSTMGELYKEFKKDDWKYNWIPGLMARKFSSEPRNLVIKNGVNRNLLFHHVFFNGNHECMAEPVKSTEKKGAFSYVIRFSLKNRGGLPEPSILNVSFGIRRILQKGIFNNYDIHQTRKGSILISLQNPFIAENLKSLSYAQLKYKKQRNGQVTWVDGADNLFADLIGVPFQPDHILNDPIKYMKSTHPSALAVYSDLVFTSKYNLSKLISGIGLPEKWALFELLVSTFPYLKTLKPCTSVSLSKDSFGNKRLPLQHSYTPNSKLTLEFWGEVDLYNQVITTLINEKIVFENSDGTYRLNAEPIINLDIQFRNTRKLAEALDTNQKSKSIDHRVKWVKKYAESNRNDSLLTLSLIEIGKKEDYEGGTDPKRANRDGLVQANRVSQFIYPMDPDEKANATKSRILNSFFDLLMDHGFLPGRADNLKHDVIFLGFGMIKGKVKGNGYREGYLPVMTRIYQNQVKVRLFGRNDWLTLQEALLSAGKLTFSSFLEKPSKNYETVNRYKSFFKRAVESCLDEYDSNIVIFLDAKLRNEKWTELTNPKLNQHNIPFTLDYPEAANRVRVVRVNTTDDVSQYRINPQGEVRENRNQGLFKDLSGIYYSVGARPDNMQRPLEMQKYNNPTVQILHQRPVELIPLGTENQEERDQLAIWAHNLRKMNIAYNFHATLPYPMDIIKSIKKYITILEDDNYEDNDPDTFEEWISEDENAQLVFTFTEI